MYCLDNAPSPISQSTHICVMNCLFLTCYSLPATPCCNVTVGVGDMVDVDEVVAEIETDKVILYLSNV